MTDLFALYPEDKPAKASTKEATVKDKKEATKEATGTNGEPAKEAIKPMPGIDDQINKLEDKLNFLKEMKLKQ